VQPFISLLFIFLLTSFAALAQGPSFSFSELSGGATSAGSVASATGDFNRDGKLDLAIVQAGTESVGILLGKGDGTFKTGVSYSVPSCVPSFLVTGDFKKDGKLDLLGTCAGQPMFFVLPGNGDGTFGAAIETVTADHILSGLDFLFVGPLAVADFNGDGQLDLGLVLVDGADFKAAQFPGSSLGLYLGNGDGTFTPATTAAFLPAGQMPVEALAVDLNGDGIPDLAGVSITVAPSGGNADLTGVYLWSALNEGDGNFALVTDTSISGLPFFGISTADVNGDGVPDIILAGPDISINEKNKFTQSSVNIELGNGDGTFRMGFSQSDPSDLVAVNAWPVDLQGTGLPDLVELSGFTAGTSSIKSAVVAVRANNGDGTFAAPQTLSSASNFLPFSYAFGDFNGDGLTDIQANALSPGATVDLKDSMSLANGLSRFPVGLNEILLNTTPIGKFVMVDAASYAPGPVATGSIVAAFGTGLATSTAAAGSLPLPLTLGGASVTVTDSAGTGRAAPLFYASPTQLNFAIPAGTASGEATIAITSGTATLKIQKPVVSVAPGLFGVNGVAIGNVLTYVNGAATPVVSNTFNVSSTGEITAAPIDVGSGSTQVFLVLYGTGIRNHMAAVTATIGSTTATAAYAGPQNVFVGEDQVNIPLPQILAGAGTVRIRLSIDGQATNVLQVAIQ
jgi:uncharacterized protein (TIGR03437 family)